MISRMVALGAVDDVIAAGIEPKHFLDKDCRDVYDSCLKHVRAWREPPAPEIIRKRHPEFDLQQVRSEMPFLIENFKQDYAYKVALEKWRDIGKMLDSATPGDPEYDPDIRSQLAERFMEHAREMALLLPAANMTRFSDMAERIMALKQQQESGVKPGVKLGIPVLEPWVDRVRPGEFVVHCAYSSRGKTTGMVRSAVQSYLDEDTPLFASLEMSADEIWAMFDAHATGLSRRAITRRELGESDWVQYEQAAQRAEAAANDIIVFDNRITGVTIDKLAGWVERYGPKTVCVDYISLMQPINRKVAKWEAVAEISADLKRMASAYGIKVYAAAQNTRDAAVDGPTEDNIAHSNTIFQDCNIMVGYHQTDDMKKKNQVEVRLVKNRADDKPVNHPLEYWDRDRLIFEEWRRDHEWRVRMDAPA